MRKLHEILAQVNKPGCKVGIEIEAEGRNIKMTNLPKWSSTDDGSLRGAFPNERHEFVSGILDIGEVEKEISNLAEEQKDAEFNFSFRTSTHVHVNALDMDVQQVVSFVYLYYLFEKDMMRYCGESRNNNRFCLRIVDSEFQVDILRAMIENGFRDLRFIIDDNMRYGGCNLAALMKYGTLEFRGMRGTMDKKVLMNWIGMLTRLRELAIAAPSTMQIFAEATGDAKNFIKKIYGPYYEVYYNEDSLQNLSEALSLTVQIPFIMEQHKDKDVQKVRAKGAIDPGAVPQAVLRANAAGNQGFHWDVRAVPVGARQGAEVFNERVAQEVILDDPFADARNLEDPAIAHARRAVNRL